MTIFHIAHAAEWAEAERTGQYRISTRDRTLDEIGFIHCSTREQVASVQANFYADDPAPLILLELDPIAIEAAGTAVRWEDVGSGELFPHVYGALRPEFVVSTHAL